MPCLWYDNQAEEAVNHYISIFKDGKVNSITRYGDEAISLIIDCKNQAEVDERWEKLSEGGSKSQCGWLKDKYGLSWQVVPASVIEMVQDPDPEKNTRLMLAMFKMQKLDIAALTAAYNG